MNDTKPTTIDEYKIWLNNEHGVAITTRTTDHYQSVVRKVRGDFQASIIWRRLVGGLQRLNDEYLLAQKYPLWTATSEPRLEIKSFDSFFLKTFRKNVVENSAWPSPPPEGWILPTNWFSRIDDTVRTLLIVKYLDGVEFAVEKLHALCATYKTRCSSSFQAKEEGYYAAHVYITRRFEVPRETWDTQRLDVSVEFHIATQLQDVIRRLLHEYYEKRRVQMVGARPQWQWDYRSDEFAANYLGHILHYVEGMIMDVRKRQHNSVSRSGGI